MSISAYKTFVSGEILTASDLNASFSQIIDNGEDLGWPATKAKDLDGQKLILDGDADSSIHASTDDQIDVEVLGFDALRVIGVSSAVNGLDIKPSATTNALTLTARGSDTDISINMVPKGSGTLQSGGSALMTNPLTTRGDLLYRNATVPARLAVGSSGDLLTTDGTDPSWDSTSNLGLLKNISEDTTPSLGGALDGDGNTIDDVLAVIDARTGTSETTADTDSGQVITLTNSSAITLTVHQGAPAGFVCTIIQGGAGQVTVAAGGTGNVRNASSHTKLSGQYAMGTIIVRSNAGTAPEVYLAGDTG